MFIRKLRLRKGWSQSQLADLAGVTTRTVQRLERGHRPSVETAKALGAVFEVEFSRFLPEETSVATKLETTNNGQNDSLTEAEQGALAYARRMKEFYESVITFVLLAVVFLTVFRGESVVILIFCGLGIGLVVQGLIACEKLGFLNANWERRLAERKLGRKL